MSKNWALWLLPHDNFTLHTRLAPGSVRLRLHDVLDQGNARQPGCLGFLGYPPGTYKGTEQDSIFHLYSANYGPHRVVHLKGVIEPQNSGSMIRVSVQFPASRYLSHFAPICLLVGIAWIVIQNVNAWQDAIAWLTVLGVGWYAFGLYDFWRQADRDKRFLKDFLGADESQL